MVRLLITLAVLLAAIPSRAQNEELNRLTDIVMQLKAGGETNYNAAVKALGADRLWTPMDELGRVAEAECRAADRVPGFRLNSALTNAENAQRYQTTTGNHLNGADSRFNYSLYEKTLKAGKSVRYTLPERWGEQVLIIVPYRDGDGNLAVSATCGGKEFATTPLGKGAVKLSGNAVKGQPLEIKVTNTGSENLSYVIINYNSRK